MEDVESGDPAFRPYESGTTRDEDGRERGHAETAVAGRYGPVVHPRQGTDILDATTSPGYDHRTGDKLHNVSLRSKNTQHKVEAASVKTEGGRVIFTNAAAEETGNFNSADVMAPALAKNDPFLLS